MRYLQADRLYPVSRPFIPEGIVVVDDDGILLDVIDPSLRKEDAGQLLAAGKVERMEGWLVPGFINAHCHLELSWMLGRIGVGEGLTAFIRQVVRLRNESETEVRQAMMDAEAQMMKAGIVAVGDISNTSVSLDVKKSGRLRYHTFVETFDLDPEKADLRFTEALALAERFQSEGLGASVVPHAPYTVSERLMKRLLEFSKKSDALLSIHNQESAEEESMFRAGRGELLEFLQTAGGAPGWSPTGESSLQTLLPQLAGHRRSLMVHNTFTGEVDSDKAAGYGLWWCMCPNANLFIERRLPDIPMFLRKGLTLLLGTDSLASNGRLSVLEEMKTLARAFPVTDFGALLAAATRNGAAFFRWEKDLGTIEPGKRPGINLIENVDPDSVSGLTDSSTVRPVA